MRFVLHYRGPLKANGGPDHKHQIRLNFHQQLARLWQEEPLKGHQNLLNPEPMEGRYHLRLKLTPFSGQVDYAALRAEAKCNSRLMGLT